MKEEWKDMINYESLFMISNKGNVFSKRSNKLLKLNPTGKTNNKKGYLSFITRLNGANSKSIVIKAHQEVAKAFLDPPQKYIQDWSDSTKYRKPFINHIDGNQHNNEVSNLEWCTNSENLKHYHSELKLTPTKHTSGSKPSLKDYEVKQIRELVKYGFSERVIAKMYTVSRSSINAAKSGYKWVN